MSRLHTLMALPSNHEQDVTIRLIAQNGILCVNAALPRGRSFVDRATKMLDRRSAAATSPPTGELYMQGEAATGKVSLPPPKPGRKYHLFCSEFNAGAEELAKELGDSTVFVVHGRWASAPLTFTSELDHLATCDRMLVVLDERTWTSGEDTAKLVEHIHKAILLGVQRICVHEYPSVVGPRRHACDFARMVRCITRTCHQYFSVRTDLCGGVVSV